MSGRWLVCLAKADTPAFDLVCLPWAGGGATGYRPLNAHRRPEMSLWAVTPPGREQRLMEASETDLDRWIEAIGRELSELSHPLVLFGHSFGSVLAFELAHWLHRYRGGAVKLVCVSLRRPPGRPSAIPHLADAPDGDLIAWMRRLGGAPAELLASAEMLDLILPPLRDDIRLDCSYQPRQSALDAPILAFASHDDPLVSAAEVRDWREWTKGGFELSVLPGGHFYLQDRPDRIFESIRKALDGQVDPGPQEAGGQGSVTTGAEQGIWQCRN